MKLAETKMLELDSAATGVDIYETADEMLQKTFDGSFEMTPKLKSLIEDEDSFGFLSGIETFIEKPSNNGWVFAEDSLTPDRVLPTRYGHKEAGPAFGLVATIRPPVAKFQLFAGSFVNNQIGKDARQDLRRSLRYKSQDFSMLGYATRFRFKNEWTEEEVRRYGDKAIVIFDEYMDKQIAAVDNGGMDGARLISADGLGFLIKKAKEIEDAAQAESDKQALEQLNLSRLRLRARVVGDLAEASLAGQSTGQSTAGGQA